MVDSIYCSIILSYLCTLLPLSNALFTSPFLTCRNKHHCHGDSKLPSLRAGKEDSVDVINANDDDDDEHHPHHRELVEWLSSRGINCDNCEVSVFPGGLRGLASTRHASTGTVLLKVPLKSCLLTCDFDHSIFEGAAPSWSTGLPNKVQLALQVLHHHQGDNGEESLSDSSSYRPFLNSWPNSISSIPSFPENIPREELVREAQSDVLVEEIDKHKSWVSDQFEAVKKAAPPTSIFSSPSFSLEKFTRALQLAGSRSISIQLPSSPSSSSGKGSVLVPLFDMANHHPNPTATYRLVSGSDDNNNDDDDEGGESIELVARKDISEGEEITISYGAYPNSIMAKCYGFVPTNNPYDFERVSMRGILQAAMDAGALLETTDLSKAENSVAALGFDTTNNSRILATGPEESLWMSLRAALVTNDDEYEELLEVLEAIEMDEADDEDLWEMDNDADIVRRAKIAHAAFTALEHGISAKSTLEEDEEILLRNDTTALSCGSRLLVELRSERKRLLRSASWRMAAVMGRPREAREILSL